MKIYRTKPQAKKTDEKKKRAIKNYKFKRNPIISVILLIVFTASILGMFIKPISADAPELFIMQVSDTEYGLLFYDHVVDNDAGTNVWVEDAIYKKPIKYEIMSESKYNFNGKPLRGVMLKLNGGSNNTLGNYTSNIRVNVSYNKKDSAGNAVKYAEVSATFTPSNYNSKQPQKVNGTQSSGNIVVYSGSNANPNSKPPVISVDNTVKVDGESITDDEFNDNRKPNIVEKYLAGLFTGLGDWVYKKIKGFDIDTLVFNSSVDQYGIRRESKFKLDFDENTASPFGKMGHLLYKIFQSFSLIAMLIILMIQGSRLQMNVITKNKVEFSETINNYILGIVLLYFFPQIFSFFMMLFNMIIGAFNPTAAGASFFETLRAAAVDNNNSTILADSMLYFASSLLSLYFGFVYASRALHVTLFFFMFPIMVLYMNMPKFKQNFDNFVSDLMSTVSIQLVDASLILGLVVLFGYLGLDSSLTFWKFVMFASVIPLRSMAKKYLGFTKDSLMSDMLGFAALTGIAGIAGGLARGGKSLVGGVAGGISDIKRGNAGLADLDSVINKYGIDGSTGVASAAAMRANNVGEIDYSSHMNADASKLLPSANFGAGLDSGGVGATASGVGGLDSAYKELQVLDKKRNYEKMRTDGYKNILRSVGSATGGLAGAGIGSVAGLGFGVNGMIYGALAGGSIGDFVGNIAGQGISMMIPYKNHKAPNMEVSQDSARVAQGSVTGEGGAALVTIKDEPNSLWGYQQQYSVYDEEYPKEQIYWGASQAGASGQLGSQAISISEKTGMVDLKEELNRYHREMPTETHMKIKNQVTAQVDNKMNSDAFDSLNHLDRQVVRSQLAYHTEASMTYDYAINQIKMEHPGIDTNALNSASKAFKQNLSNNFNNILGSYNIYDYSVDIDAI